METEIGPLAGETRIAPGETHPRLRTHTATLKGCRSTRCSPLPSAVCVSAISDALTGGPLVELDRRQAILRWWLLSPPARLAPERSPPACPGPRRRARRRRGSL